MPPITREKVRTELDRVRGQLESARKLLDELVELHEEQLGDAEFGPQGDVDEARARSDETERLRQAAELLGSADDDIEQASAIVAE